jgi:hypothetical protein
MNDDRDDIERGPWAVLITDREALATLEDALTRHAEAAIKNGETETSLAIGRIRVQLALGKARQGRAAVIPF